MHTLPDNLKRDNWTKLQLSELLRSHQWVDGNGVEPEDCKDFNRGIRAAAQLVEDWHVGDEITNAQAQKLIYANLPDKESKEFLDGMRRCINDHCEDFGTFVENFGALAMDVETGEVFHVGEIPREMMIHLEKNSRNS